MLLLRHNPLMGRLSFSALSVLLAISPALAEPPSIDPMDDPARPHLRAPAPETAVVAPLHHAHLASVLAHPAAPLPTARPVVQKAVLSEPEMDDAAREASDLRRAMAEEVAYLLKPSRASIADAAQRASALLGQSGKSIDRPQLVVVVDRNPGVQRLYLMLARPEGAASWRLIGAAHVSTGQAGRKDYYITPVGVFAHTEAILDFRAQGTFNEHHVRGIGLAGMRVWDFGWQWALKGWHTDFAGGDIRLQMHATDPALLERKLGHPASEGCVRVSSSMNRFLDLHGVLDADYEVAAVTDPRYENLLSKDRTPSSLGGRLMIVIDTGLPADGPPTVASRPADWPAPATVSPDGGLVGTQ